MRRYRRLALAAIGVLALLSAFFSAERYLSKNDIGELAPYTYCSFYYYEGNFGRTAGSRKTRMYLEGITFKEAEALIAAKLPSWRHHHFIKDNKNYYLYRMEDANFEPPHAWWPIIELQDVLTLDGQHYLRVSESQDLSTVDFALGRIAAFGADPMDGTDLHIMKMSRKPYSDFPRGITWKLDQKLGANQ